MSEARKAWRRAAALVRWMPVMVLLAGPIHGQTTGYSTVVQVPNLNCSTSAGSNMFAVISWSVAAENASNGASRAAGRANGATLGPLQVVKAFDSCSPALFGSVASGVHIPTVTLTETHNGSQLLTIQLSQVIATSDQLADLGPSSGPAETVSFSYGRISITNHGQGGGTFCWDVTRSAPCSS